MTSLQKYLKAQQKEINPYEKEFLNRIYGLEAAHTAAPVQEQLDEAYCSGVAIVDSAFGYRQVNEVTHTLFSIADKNGLDLQLMEDILKFDITQLEMYAGTTYAHMAVENHIEMCYQLIITALHDHNIY